MTEIENFMGFKIGVLGGLGLMAEAALHDLACQPDVSQILIVDLNVGRKENVLSKIPQRRKIRILSLDLTDTAKSARALNGIHVLLNAAWYEFNLKAMDLALAVGAHYLDLGGLYHMTLRQLKRDREFTRKGLLGLLGCGSTPGLTNMMVAEMAEAFDTVDTVGIYDAGYDPSLGKSGFLPPFSIRTMLDEYVMPAPILERGRIVQVPAHSRSEALEFKEPIGKCTAGAVIHSEAATLPDYLKNKGVKNLAFKIVYPDIVREQLELLTSMGFSKDTPVKVNGSSVSPRRFVTALAQSGAVSAEAGKPADFEIARVRIEGSKASRPKVLEWDCEIRPEKTVSAGAVGVGFTAAVIAHMIVSGEVQRNSGICAPESGLPGRLFFKRLASRKSFRLVERTESPLRGF